MESQERLVLHDEVGDGDRLTNGLFGNLAIPLARDLFPRQAIVKLFKNDPHHDPCALERGLTTANLRVSHNLAAKLDSAGRPICFRFHTAHYPRVAIHSQADDSRDGPLTK